MLGTGATAVCIGCHAPDSKGYAAAARMRTAVDDLHQTIVAAEAALGRATTAGMEMGEEEFVLQAAREALIQTRNQVHAFDVASLEKAASEGREKAQDVERSAGAALAEFRNRRWLATIPLGMIVIVGALLYAKIRSLDREAPPSGS
jgi:flagellin-like hook-associated protein FlgL